MTYYRKATKQEIDKIYINLKHYYSKKANPPEYEKYVKHIKEYYPKNAHKANISLNSEYDDSDYNYTLSYLVVFDKEENELVPITGKSIEARAEFSKLGIPDYEDLDNKRLMQLGNAPLSLSIYLEEDVNSKLPEIYIKC